MYLHSRNKKKNLHSVTESISISEIDYYKCSCENQNINDDIINVPPYTNTSNLHEIQVPSKVYGISKNNSHSSVVIVTDENETKDGFLFGRSINNNYAYINEVNAIGSLSQNDNNTKINPSIDNINIAMGLNELKETIKNKNTDNSMVITSTDNVVEPSDPAMVMKLPLTESDNNIQLSPMDKVTQSVVQSELVENVQKNTENILKSDLSTSMTFDKANDVSKTVATKVAEDVEKTLVDNNLPVQNTSTNDVKNIITKCIYNNFKDIYTMPQDAFNQAITITEKTLNDVDPKKYKLLIEIVHNQPLIKEAVNKIAAQVAQSVANNGTVVNNGSSSAIVNVDVNKVAQDVVNNTTDASNTIANTIDDIKNNIRSDTTTTINDNKITVIANGTDKKKAAMQSVNRLTADITNNTIETFFGVENFSQSDRKCKTNISSKLPIYDNRNRKISLNKLVNSIVEHMVSKTTDVVNVPECTQTPTIVSASTETNTESVQVTAPVQVATPVQVTAPVAASTVSSTQALIQEQVEVPAPTVSSTQVPAPTVSSTQVPAKDTELKTTVVTTANMPCNCSQVELEKATNDLIDKTSADNVELTQDASGLLTITVIDSNLLPVNTYIASINSVNKLIADKNNENINTTDNSVFSVQNILICLVLLFLIMRFMKQR
jgi:hypothetical protein